MINIAIVRLLVNIATSKRHADEKRFINNLHLFHFPDADPACEGTWRAMNSTLTAMSIKRR